MNEKELSEAIRTLESYRMQLENLDQQFEFLTMTMKEHNQAKETMEAYKDLKEDQETLIPVGAGVHIFAKVGESHKAMVGVGADVIAEKTIDDAVAMMEERITEVEEALKSLTARYKETSNKAQELSVKIQSAYRK